MAFKTTADVARLRLPEGKAEMLIADARGTGLHVRLQRAGRPSWVAAYTLHGKRRKLALGAVPSMSLDEARAQASRIVAAAREGTDPAAQRREARGPAVEAFSVGRLLEIYVADAAQRQRPRTLVETRRHLEHHCAPIHASPAVDLGRRQVSALLLNIAAQSGRIAANRCRASLSAAYAWAMRAGLVDQNPVVGTVRADERSRERVLDVAELAAIWAATSSLDAHDRMVRLLLLTGARRQEVGGMHAAELDRERGLWTLPGLRSKNGVAHEVPLPRQAVELLPEGDGYLFGRGGKAPFSGWSRCKARLDARIASQRGEPLPAWHIHDLRRTAVTLMAEIGIAPHIIEAIVNHISGHKSGVAGVYNRAQYRQEKAAALQRWADFLEREMGAPAKVVTLRRGR